LTAADSSSDLDGIRAALQRLRAEFAPVLLAYVVHSKGNVPPVDFTMEVEDRAGTFAETYGAEAGTTILIRPDGHVGYRAEAFDAALVRKYLSGAAAPTGMSAIGGTRPS